MLNPDYQQGKYISVQTVKPGLTSYASLFDYTHGDAVLKKDVAFYDANIIPIKQELELYYIQHAGIITDTIIVLKTAIIITLVFKILFLIFVPPLKN